MIVSDDTVSKAVQYLAEDPHPLARAQTAVMFAEKAREEAFAKLYLAAEGTRDERTSRVMLDAVFQAAKTAEIDATFEETRHKRRVEAAKEIIEVWRTQNANARAAERVR
jgi:hypothetical protein